MARPQGGKVEFPGGDGARLAARLDVPAGEVRATALFAHCFTCSKDIFAARIIASELAALGIAVLRFDFTGLGSSEGEFASTNFSSNVADLVRAADWLRERLAAPALLVGHSLGGAAVVAAAAAIPEAKAVATIGAPADAAHVKENFAAHLERIESEGEAEVSLAGRTFTIRKQFLDDLEGHRLEDAAKGLKRALLVLHAPKDAQVGIDNATRLFVAARHPKSFVSLDEADHLLSRHEDARYAAHVIAAWASRYLPALPPRREAPAMGAQEIAGVTARETGRGRYETALAVGRHAMIADEPASVGGGDQGPTPYDYLSMALAACTSMTLRMYADRKKLEGLSFDVDVRHDKVHAADCEDCIEEIRAREGKVDRFEVRLAIRGTDDPELRARLVEISGKCPVKKTLAAGAAVVTLEVPAGEARG